MKKINQHYYLKKPFENSNSYTSTVGILIDLILLFRFVLNFFKTTKEKQNKFDFTFFNHIKHI